MIRHLRRSPLPALLALLLVPAAPPPATAAITTPPGYYALTWATGVPQPTSISFGPDGWLYVTHLEGEVTAMKDLDGNGTADTTVVFSSGLVWPLGLAHHAGSVYVTSLNRLTRYTDTNADRVADLTATLVDTIPSGRHWTTAVVAGPDNRLYVGVGSQKNLDVNNRPWFSSVLRFEPDGTFVDIFAGGFRNPYDLAFHADGSLFGTENGAAPNALVWECEEAPDELNWIRPGHDYGFPYCHGVGDCADLSEYCATPPCGPGDCQWGGGCQPGMTAPLVNLDPHSSSDGMTFGAGFAGFDGDDLFIAQFGQSEAIDSCLTAFGRKVVRVRLTNNAGTWTAGPVEDFVTGMNRPLDVTVGPDSSLYVADYADGKIVRIFRIQAGAVPEGGSGVRPGAPAFAMSPNPARHRARLAWSGPPPDRARVQVFDVGGRRVADLGELRGEAAGWSLTDAAGRRVTPGIYLVRAEIGGRTATARLVVVE